MFFSSIKYLYPNSVALNVSGKTSIDDLCTMGGLQKGAILKPIVTITLKDNLSWQILLHGETRNWVFYVIFSLKANIQTWPEGTKYFSMVTLIYIHYVFDRRQIL